MSGKGQRDDCMTGGERHPTTELKERIYRAGSDKPLAKFCQAISRAGAPGYREGPVKIYPTGPSNGAA